MIFSTLFFACALSPFLPGGNCADSFSAAVVNHQCGMVRVIRRLVDVHVIHRNDWDVSVRSSACMILVCGVAFLGLHADRAPVHVKRVSHAVSVVYFWAVLRDLRHREILDLLQRAILHAFPVV